MPGKAGEQTRDVCHSIGLPDRVYNRVEIMAYVLVIDVPGLPPSQNARMGFRERARENLKWKRLVGMLVAGKKPPSPLLKATGDVVLHSSRPRDHDNLIASIKPLWDGLVEAGVLSDDTWEVIGCPTYRWEKAPAKLGHVVITVEADGESEATP